MELSKLDKAGLISALKSNGYGYCERDFYDVKFSSFAANGAAVYEVWYLDQETDALDFGFVYVEEKDGVPVAEF